MTATKILHNDAQLREIKPHDYLILNEHKYEFRNLHLVVKVDSNSIEYMSMVDSSINVRDFVNFEDGSWSMVLLPNAVRKLISLPNRENY